MNDVTERITTYLINGGVFNPELADHSAVRSLLIDARAELAAERESATKANLDFVKMLRRADALEAERDALRELLRKVKNYVYNIDKRGQIDAALNKGGGGHE